MQRSNSWSGPTDGDPSAQESSQPDLMTAQLPLELILALQALRRSDANNKSSSTRSGSSNLKPPKMGGITLLNEKEEAWTGGPPALGWNGLRASAPGYVNPNQLRHQKNPEYGYNARSKALDTLFSQKGDVKAFTTQIDARLVDHGMDTVFYRPDPLGGESDQDHNEMREGELK